jgi:hypothetical protein
MCKGIPVVDVYVTQVLKSRCMLATVSLLVNIAGWQLTFKNRASYIYNGRTLHMLHFIYIYFFQQI